MTAPSDLLARAYATLGLPPGCSRREATRQYKRLARRWHPDQYAHDPQGQAEATQRMREINLAFALVRKAHAHRIERDLDTWAPASSDALPRYERAYGRRLTPEELDAIAEAIGTPQ